MEVWVAGALFDLCETAKHSWSLWRNNAQVWPQVYTVGPDYAHAEARKSPALDGKVERDSEGKEVRYPVMLSAMEKLVARKVCLAFQVTRAAVFTADAPQRRRLSFYFPCSKPSVGSIFSEPTATLTSATSTALALWRTRWSTTTTAPRSLGTVFVSAINRPRSACLCWLCSPLQEHCDARTGAAVSDSLVHPNWGRGHPYCSHHFRDHVSVSSQTSWPERWTLPSGWVSAIALVDLLLILASGWSCAVSLPSSAMETELPSRRWRWKFATPCTLCLCLPQHICWMQANHCSVSFRFFDLFEKYGGYKTGKLKLKKPKQLQVPFLWRVVWVCGWVVWRWFIDGPFLLAIIRRCWTSPGSFWQNWGSTTTVR